MYDKVSDDFLRLVRATGCNDLTDWEAQSMANELIERRAKDNDVYKGFDFGEAQSMAVEQIDAARKAGADTVKKALDKLGWPK